MLITQVLSNNALLYGDETAIIDLNYIGQCELSRNTINWQEFDKQSNQFANYLLLKNIQKKNKIAMLMNNSIEYLIVYFGILKTGAVVVPINCLERIENILYCLDLTECTMLVFSSDFNSIVDKINDKIKSAIDLVCFSGNPSDGMAVYKNEITNFLATAPNIDIYGEEPAAIYFSSGTTGVPKAILHKHEVLFAVGEIEKIHHRQNRDDVFLCLPPLYHTGAMVHWLGSLLVGGKAVLMKGVSPKGILTVVSNEKISIVWLLVHWAQDILDAIEQQDVMLCDYDLSAWRLMHIGAQSVPEGLIKKWLNYFPDKAYDTNYGLTESAGPGCVHLGIDNISKAGAIGKAGSGWEVAIVDEEGKITPPGEVGELILKGPGIMIEYYNDPKATEEVLRNGWLYTGDLVKMDAEGFIYLVGRKKDIIITGGEKIYPIEVENFLKKYDKIKDVAIVGIIDARLGEVIASIVELQEDTFCNKREIMEYCKVLPWYKRPRKIIFAPILRNALGKIDKNNIKLKYL